jgi:hypothetical protein
MCPTDEESIHCRLLERVSEMRIQRLSAQQRAELKRLGETGSVNAFDELDTLTHRSLVYPIGDKTAEATNVKAPLC